MVTGGSALSLPVNMVLRSSASQKSSAVWPNAMTLAPRLVRDFVDGAPAVAAAQVAAVLRLLFEQVAATACRGSRSTSMPRCFRYSPSGSMGRRNLPCSTVKAQTEKSMGARFCSSSSTSSMVAESLPPESATATRSPSRIMLKRWMASPTLRSSVFSRSTISIIVGSAAQVLVEEVERALPGQLGGGFVVARRGVVVEAVVGALIDVAPCR